MLLALLACAPSSDPTLADSPVPVIPTSTPTTPSTPTSTPTTTPTPTTSGTTSTGALDLDGDGLDGATEQGLGTDPANPDTDGDGWRDGDEVELGLDPTVAQDDFYTGGWPYDPTKDLLPAGSFGVGPSIGAILPHATLDDQYGEPVDLYDFAEHGRPVVLVISAQWSGPDNELARWISGDSPTLFGELDDHLPQEYAAGSFSWVVILTEDLGGNGPDATDAAAFANLLGPVDVPILADTGRDYARWLSIAFYPSMVMLDESMAMTVDGTGADAYWPVLDELLVQFP